MVTPKTLWKMWYAFFWTLMACGLVYPGYTFIKVAREAAQKGEVTVAFWLPKDAEIYTDPEAWMKYIQDLKRTGHFHRNVVGIDEYKRVFGNEKHKILLLAEHVSYVTFCGPIEVASDQVLDYPNFVSVKSYRHMGDGVVNIDLGGVNYLGAIVTGLICGLLLDLMLAMVCGIFLLVVISIHDKIKGFA